MDYITFDEFAKVEVRVGTIVSAHEPELSDKLIEYVVDFGEEIGKRTIFSGIRKWFSAADLVGKQTTFVINLAPKRMGSLGESEGMLFAADGSSGPVLVEFASVLANGTRLI